MSPAAQPFISLKQLKGELEAIITEICWLCIRRVEVYARLPERAAHRGVHGGGWLLRPDEDAVGGVGSNKVAEIRKTESAGQRSRRKRRHVGHVRRHQNRLLRAHCLPGRLVSVRQLLDLAHLLAGPRADPLQAGQLVPPDAVRVRHRPSGHSLFHPVRRLTLRRRHGLHPNLFAQVQMKSRFVLSPVARRSGRLPSSSRRRARMRRPTSVPRPHGLEGLVPHWLVFGRSEFELYGLGYSSMYSRPQKSGPHLAITSHSVPVFQLARRATVSEMVACSASFPLFPKFAYTCGLFGYNGRNLTSKVKLTIPKFRTSPTFGK